jgi:hypothetical protein
VGVAETVGVEHHLGSSGRLSAIAMSAPEAWPPLASTPQVQGDKFLLSVTPANRARFHLLRAFLNRECSGCELK